MRRDRSVVVIALAVLGLNLLGDGLAALLEPRADEGLPSRRTRRRAALAGSIRTAATAPILPQCPLAR